MVVYRNKPTAAWSREVEGTCESALHDSRDAQRPGKSHLYAQCRKHLAALLSAGFLCSKMILYFSPSVCSISSEQCFYLKYVWMQIFLHLLWNCLEPQKVILTLATAHFLWCHQDPAQDFLIAQTKYQWGKADERLLVINKTIHKLFSQIPAYFL